MLVKKRTEMLKKYGLFQINNMLEFTNLYNKVDVLLLADIMENLRNVSLQNYKLDQAWYFTTPGACRQGGEVARWSAAP
jgi:hypothetical protein